MSTETQQIAETIAHKINRQQQRHADLLGQSSASAADIAHRASRVAQIEGRIDGLTEALEIILGVDVVTYDVIERLTVAHALHAPAAKG